MAYRIVKKPPPLDHIKTDSSFLLWQASNVVQRHFERCLEPLGLTYTQYVVLRTLVLDMGGRAMKQKYLVKRTGIHKMIISQAVSALIRNKYIMRRTSERDRRSVCLRSTVSGRELLQKAADATVTIESQLLNIAIQKPGFYAGLRAIKELKIT